MFRFPSCPNRRKRWVAQVKRDCWEPTTASRICEAHFEETSFEQHRQDGLKKLRPDAVPTLFAYCPLPKHRLPPKKLAAASTLPRMRTAGVSSDRISSVQPRATSARAPEVAPLPSVTSEARSVLRKSCAFAYVVDTPLLTVHSGDTPSYTDGAGNAISACESLPLDNVQGGSAVQSWCTQESLASVYQDFDSDDTAVEDAAHISCLQTCGGFVIGVTPSPDIGTSALENEPECEGGEALSAHLFTTGSSTAENTSLIQRENAELRKKNADLTRKYKSLQKLHEKAKSQLRSVRKKLASAQQKLDALTTSSFPNKNQTTALLKKTTKGSKWSEKTVRVAD